MSSPYEKEIREILDRELYCGYEEFGYDQEVKYGNAIKELVKLIDGINAKRNKKIKKSVKVEEVNIEQINKCTICKYSRINPECSPCCFCSGHDHYVEGTPENRI